MLVLTILVRRWVVVSVDILSHALINHDTGCRLGVYQDMANCMFILTRVKYHWWLNKQVYVKLLNKNSLLMAKLSKE